MIVPLAALAVALAAATADPQCRQGDTVNLAPAVMLDRANQFRDSLDAESQARLDAALPRTAGGRIAQCAGRDGATCDAGAYMAAFRSTGLMPRFLQSICATRPAKAP